MATPLAATPPQLAVFRQADADRIVFNAANPYSGTVPKGGILKAVRMRREAVGAVGVTATLEHDAMGAAAGTGTVISLGGSLFAVDARTQSLRAVGCYDRGKVPWLRAVTGATLVGSAEIVDFGYGPNDMTRGIPLDAFSQVRLTKTGAASDDAATTPVLTIDFVKIVEGGPADPEFRQFVERDNFASGTSAQIHNTLVGTPDKLVAHYITMTAYDATMSIQQILNGSQAVIFATRLDVLLEEALDRVPGVSNCADGSTAVTSTTFATQSAQEMAAGLYAAGTGIGTESAARLKLDVPGQVYDLSIPTAFQVSITRPTATVARFLEERLVKKSTIGAKGAVGKVAPASS